MRIGVAKIVTERSVLVGIPDDLETVVAAGHGTLMVVEPGSGVSGPKVLLSLEVALNRGLLVKVADGHAAEGRES